MHGTVYSRLQRSIPRLVFVAIVLGGFALPLCAGAADADSPAAELASFQIADGFEVNLFASETNGVVKPIQIRFDARGRLWVIGSTVYPFIQPGQKPDDKVVVLEDSDQDGRADKTTVFADGLMIPTGLEVIDNGCYVGHGTELLLLRDTDGDGRADERRVVLRGFGTGDNHQNINSFMWGEGGELYFCQGLHIRSHVETPWGLTSLEEAGLWRLRPKLLKLEGFYGSANEPQNPWGWVFNEWGEPIVIAGNNSSHIYPVPGMVLRPRTDPPALIWKNGNGRKCSNGDIVGTEHFPEKWQGTLIVGGYINNAVWALQIKEDGAGFALEDLPPLIKSTSRSFRPVDAKFGPDGALYIADWYNPIIGHYQASFRDPNRDKVHGRIWRVTAKGRPLTPRPQLAAASLPELFTALKSPDRWTRHFAKRVLAERPGESVLPALNQWIARADVDEHALKEALGVFQSHEAVAPELLARLCAAKNPGARAYAASVAGQWADRLPNALDLLRPLIRDEHPRVRLQAIVAATYVTNAHAIEAVAAAADFPADKFLQYAFGQAVFALKPWWLPELRAGRLNLGTNSTRLAALVRADATADTLIAVRALLRSGSDRAVAEMCWRILAEFGGPADLAAMLDLADPEMQLRVLPALRSAARARSVQPAGDVRVSLRRLAANPDPQIKSEGLKLAGMWKVVDLRPAAIAAATNLAAPVSLRRAAIEALGDFAEPSSREILATIARDDAAASVRAAAIVALIPADLPAAAMHGAAALHQLSDESPIAELIAAFVQRQGGPAALAKALAVAPPSPRAGQVGLELMNAGGRRDDRLAAIFAAAAVVQTHNSAMAPPEIRAFAAEVAAHGNTLRGSEVFHRPQLGCINCHSVNGEGGNIGPNLSALGSAQPIDFIVGAIIDPQKEVKEGFTAIAITTKDGEEYQGYPLRETREEIVLRDVLQNREVRLRRGDIQEKRTIGSVMPAGLADVLTRDEFRDLVRYLSQLGQTQAAARP